MPPIKGWTLRGDLDRYGPNTPTRVWEHRETGQIAWVSEKVPNDGYYFMVCPDEESYKENRHANSNRHGYSHLKNVTKQIAASDLRDNPEGFNYE
jgi:hypothetical protein